MEKEELTSEQEKPRQKVSADEDDILVQVLGISETDYECAVVNSSWVERGFIEGDVILFGLRHDPADGDIVLIEEAGVTRMGVAADPGYLQTRQGRRPLEPEEQIIGVGSALVRKLTRLA
jgi:hypothetical protein